MRQVGLRASELGGLGRAHLDAWARAYAKVRQMDEWVAQHGWLDEAGNPPPFAPIYFTSLNTANRSLRALGDHLRERGAEPSIVAVLQGQARRASS